ncbi:MAG: MFS transporter [Proteobacteria bacterium]|nr:MFS transporter [Pseudomonadota bacterium]
MTHPKSLYSKEFIVINIIFFITAMVMAIFFRLHPYLESININPAWIGPIMSADSMAGMFLQPVFSLMLTAGNSKRWMYLGISWIIVSLLLYNIYFTAPALIAIRILQGTGFVCVSSAIMALIAEYIPVEKSGQAFGFITSARLLPFALMPPVMGYCFSGTDGFITALRYSVVIMACAMAILFLLKPAYSPGEKQRASKRLTKEEILGNFGDRGVLMLLLINILLYTGYSMAFFFLAGYCSSKGIANPGLFFTIAVLVMIAVRFSFAVLFDRFSKFAITAVCMVGLAACYLSLPFVTGKAGFYTIAFFTGLGWGIAMPLLLAVMFDISPPSFRGLNLNMSVAMVFVGFFVSPLAGGFILERSGYDMLFYFCGILSVIAFPLIMLARRSRVIG